MDPVFPPKTPDEDLELSGTLCPFQWKTSVPDCRFEPVFQTEIHPAILISITLTLFVQEYYVPSLRVSAVLLSAVHMMRQGSNDDRAPTGLLGMPACRFA